jgi:hypothetical protein
MSSTLVPSRLREFFNWIERIAEEDAGQRSLSQRRRRGKAHFMKDRTYMFVGLALVSEMEVDPTVANLPWLLFALYFIAVGCTHLRNCRVAAGIAEDVDINSFDGIISYIRHLFDEGFDMPTLAQELQAKSWKKKAYKTNDLLSRFSPNNKWPEGFAYALAMWRSGCASVLAKALYAEPGPNTNHTIALLTTMAGLTPIAAMQYARLLGLYDARLYDCDRDLHIRAGGLPLADYLVGRPPASSATPLMQRRRGR